LGSGARCPGGGGGGGGCDLVVAAECLSYIENWKELIAALAPRTRYLMIALYLPENPIGFVKSVEELEAAVDCYFVILELVIIKKSRFVLLFGRSQST